MLPGLAALALFAVLAVVFVTATFDAPAGFAGVSVTEAIGYALFDMVESSSIVTEGFLVSFILIAVVLDAALDGTVMLAQTDDESERFSGDGDTE